MFPTLKCPPELAADGEPDDLIYSLFADEVPGTHVPRGGNPVMEYSGTSDMPTSSWSKLPAVVFGGGVNV